MNAFTMYGVPSGQKDLVLIVPNFNVPSILLSYFFYQTFGYFLMQKKTTRLCRFSLSLPTLQQTVPQNQDRQK